MQAAKPAARIIHADGSQSKSQAAPLHGPRRRSTTPYTNAPTRTHGKVFFTLGGVDYVCSGTALLSGNKSVVWTAGHCVFDPTNPGDFATNWEFVPAYKDGAAPLGVYVADNLFTSSAWGNNGDYSYDFGAAVVAPAGGTAAPTAWAGAGSRSTTTGPRATCPTAIRRRRRSPASVCGPATRRCRPATTARARRRMGIGCDMTGGSSGSSLDRRREPVSELLRYDNAAERDVRAYLDSVAQSVYNAAAAD